MEEISLLRAARSLDQGGPEAIASTLDQVWAALSRSPGGTFHAAEEVILRWLLKNMNGTSADAEGIRRWPLTWRIAGLVFQRIPLFSLAKSLSDRRFVAVLQQTVKDLSTPQTIASVQNENKQDVEMADADSPPDKRKRWPQARFDLSTLREPEWRLRTAETMFEALRLLLDRVDYKATRRLSNDRMGAEHIRALLSSSAAEAMEILVPLLRICTQAMTTQESDAFENQSTWISTFISLWGLHLQSPTDAFEVATHLSPFGSVMLARLLCIPLPWSGNLPSEVGTIWAKDLERFLTSNVILPARSAFLNRKDAQILAAAVGNTLTSASLRSCVLFRLALKAGQVVGDARAKADNDDWIRKVFDMAEEPLRPVEVIGRKEAIATMLDMATQHGMAPSLDSLRSACSEYALGEKTDWRLLSSVASCDADAFLVSSHGAELLDIVLQRMSPAEAFDQGDYELASSFVASLARGSSRARDLTGFVRKWFENLCKYDAEELKKGTAGLVWLNVEIRHTVAGLLQKSLSGQQLLALLDWLEAQEGASSDLARLVIYDAISAGINREDYIDAVNTRLFDHLLKGALGSGLPSEILSIRWRVTRRTLCAAKEAAHRIWSEIREQLSTTLRGSAVLHAETFEAFRCSFVAYTSLKFGGDDELEARKTTTAFFERLTQELEKLDDQEYVILSRETVKHLQSDRAFTEGEMYFESGPITLASYVAWILRGSSRIFELSTESTDEFAQFLDALLSRAGSHDEDQEFVTAVESTLLPAGTRAHHISNVVGRLTRSLERCSTSKAWGPRQRVAVRALLHAPKESITRALREQLTSPLLTAGAKQLNQTADLIPVLALLVKFLSGPAFNPNLKLDDLVLLGVRVNSAVEGLTMSQALEITDLFRHLATLTMKQMIRGTGELAKQYAQNLHETVQKWKDDPQPDLMVRIALLEACLSASEDAPVPRQKGGVALDLESIRSVLANDIEFAITHDIALDNGVEDVCSLPQKWVEMWTALEASRLSSMQVSIYERVRNDMPMLLTACGTICAQNSKLGWKLKTFLARLGHNQPNQPQELQFNGLFSTHGDQNGQEEVDISQSLLDGDILQEYLVEATGGYSTEELFSYLNELIAEMEHEHAGVSQLLGIHFIIKQLGGSHARGPAEDKFDLAAAHSKIAQMLPHVRSATEFRIMAQIIAMLLDERSSAMGQWNIEVTLGAVTAVCRDEAEDNGTKSSATTYLWLCRLVEVIIKRQRLRLEGHFHLLIMTLQSLLSCLVCQPWGTQGSSKGTGRKEQAKRFSRLLELVCEPSVASVMRTQKNSLNSATDAAKRSASQHMYLVLMAYIKLQLENDIPQGVKDALEPGMFSIIGITSDECRHLMNDALDPSGRAIFKEIYRRWERFGKWKGV